MALDTSFLLNRRYKPEPCTGRQREAMQQVSHEDYSIYTQRLASACEEGKEILIRLGIAAPLQSGDVCLGFHTADGDLSLAEMGTFLHAITASVPMKFVLKHYANDPSVGLRDGDVFFCNEALYGGLHNPDQIMFMPVFHDGELIAWVASAGHEPETGAIEPGGQPADARDRYAEGLKVPPVRVGENFRLRRDMLEFFENMVRYPEMMAIDTAVKLSACLRLRERLLEMAKERGKEFVVGLLRKVIEDSAVAAKDRVRRLPDGKYRCVTFLDTYGPGEALIRVPCTLVKQGETMTADFSGASPQLPGPYNAFEHIVYAHLTCMLFQYYFSDLPGSSGTLVPFDVRCTKGTFLHADPQAAISSGTAMAPITGNAFMICLDKAMFAANDPAITANIAVPPGACTRAFYFGGTNQLGKEVAGVSLRPGNTSAIGARPDKDGVEAGSFWWVGRGNAVDVEHEEMLYPYFAEYCNLAPDNAGPGKYRGGASISYGIRMHHTPGFYVQTFGLASRFPANPGLFGGYAANVRPGIRMTGADWERIDADPDVPAARNEFDLFELARRAGAKLQLTPVQITGALYRAGDFVGVVGAGAAGYGDVLDRDPEAVARDVRAGVVTRWSAEHVYCVVLREDGAVDAAATEARRAAERRQRLAEAKPYAEFVKEFAAGRPPADALTLYGEWPIPGVAKPAVPAGARVREEAPAHA
ncbi:MAG: hydantoinase B/oxoprolinase family protein [Steroidobacteraceae bacterium]